MPRLHLMVSGRVQGVGFRAFVWRRARELRLSGEVSNRRDGRVEVIASGPRRALETLRDAVREGPVAARVEHVAEDWSDDPHAGSGFHITG
ncbi:MAG TPA: acylphosphatase [Candidatus Saccharimonadaceae bacterium]|jgi:acylphosphatase|nr:acylphosphatase [Candidatus Saccharimonadaceae bacterium]